MSENSAVEGKRPSVRQCKKVLRYPAIAGEFRLLPHITDYQLAEFCCDCGKTVVLLMDTKGKNSIGSKHCPHCNQKAFACVEGSWMEVG